MPDNMAVEDATASRQVCRPLTDISPFANAPILVDFSGFAHKEMLTGSFFLLAIALAIAMAAIVGCNTTTFLWKWIIEPLFAGTQLGAASGSR